LTGRRVDPAGCGDRDLFRQLMSDQIIPERRLFADLLTCKAEIGERQLSTRHRYSVMGATCQMIEFQQAESDPKFPFCVTAQVVETVRASSASSLDAGMLA